MDGAGNGNGNGIGSGHGGTNGADTAGGELPLMTSQEVNLLIHEYLQESGYHHTAFSLLHESALLPTPSSRAQSASSSPAPSGMYNFDVLNHPPIRLIGYPIPDATPLGPLPKTAPTPYRPSPAPAPAPLTPGPSASTSKGQSNGAASVGGGAAPAGGKRRSTSVSTNAASSTAKGKGKEVADPADSPDFESESAAFESAQQSKGTAASATSGKRKLVDDSEESEAAASPAASNATGRGGGASANKRPRVEEKSTGAAKGTAGTGANRAGDGVASDVEMAETEETKPAVASASLGTSKTTADREGSKPPPTSRPPTPSGIAKSNAAGSAPSTTRPTGTARPEGKASGLVGPASKRDASPEVSRRGKKVTADKDDDASDKEKSKPRPPGLRIPSPLTARPPSPALAAALTAAVTGAASPSEASAAVSSSAKPISAGSTSSALGKDAQVKKGPVTALKDKNDAGLSGKAGVKTSKVGAIEAKSKGGIGKDEAKGKKKLENGQIEKVNGVSGKEKRVPLVPSIPKGDIVKLKGHTLPVQPCSWNLKVPGLLATGSGDGTARIWDVPAPSTSAAKAGDQAIEMEEIALCKHSGLATLSRKSDVTALQFSPEGTLLATGTEDGIARIWTPAGDLHLVLSMHQRSIFAIRWNSTGTILFTASLDATVCMWEVSSGKARSQWSTHSDSVLDIALYDDSHLVSCSMDKSIHVLAVGRSTPAHRFKGHKDEVNSLRFDPTKKLLASASDDFTIRIWSLRGVPGLSSQTDREEGEDDDDESLPLANRRGGCVVLEGHDKEVHGLEWCPGRTGTADSPRLLASASFDFTARIWDAEKGTCLFTLSKHTDFVYSLSFSPVDPSFLISGSNDCMMYFWDLKDGKLVKEYEHAGPIYEITCHPTRPQVAICGKSEEVAVVTTRDILPSSNTTSQPSSNTS